MKSTANGRKNKGMVKFLDFTHRRVRKMPKKAARLYIKIVGAVQIIYDNPEFAGILNIVIDEIGQLRFSQGANFSCLDFAVFKQH